MHACINKEKSFSFCMKELFTVTFSYRTSKSEIYYIYTHTFLNLQYLPESPGVQREWDWEMTQVGPEPVSHQLSCVSHVTYCTTALMVHANHRFLWGLWQRPSKFKGHSAPRSSPQRPATVNLIKPSNITFCLLLQPAEIGQKPAGNSLIRAHHHTLLPFLHG